MLVDTHTQILTALTVSGAALLTMTIAVVGGGYVRDCTGQHAGAGPGATTVAHLQAHLAAEPRRRPSTPDCPEPEEYTGRHRLPDAHPDHGVPLDPPYPYWPPPSAKIWIPCGHVAPERSLPNGDP